MPTPPPKGKPPTPQTYHVALRLLASGMGYKAVAQSLGLNGYTVRNWMRKIHDGEINSFGEHLHPKMHTEQQREKRNAKIIALRQDGHSARDIARELQCGLSTVNNLCAKLSHQQKIDDKQLTLDL